MTRQSDIFSRLQNHEVQPPADAFALLCSRLEAADGLQTDDLLSNRLQQLQELDVVPPAFLQQQIATAIAALPSLAFLQQLVVEPPAGIFEKIRLQLPAAKPGASVKRLLLQPYRLAVACILLVLVGFGIYWFAITPARKADIPPETAQHVTPTVTDEPHTDTPAVTAQGQAAPVYADYDNPAVVNYFTASRFRMEGNAFPVVNNDFVVTFASFQYDALPSFLNEEEDKTLLVRLDQYSFFTLSENMVNMLKKMYKVKSKGTPTRRARKEKEKLEEWKKADEKRFDLSGKNPLDPIDLAEFIFK